jgi:hypothetical protein
MCILEKIRALVLVKIWLNFINIRHHFYLVMPFFMNVFMGSSMVLKLIKNQMD